MAAFFVGVVAAAVLLVHSPLFAQEARVGALTPYARAKAEALLRERLPCMGCHALAGEGGRIGPDLGSPAPSRTPVRIRSMIDDPQRTAPGSLMPRIPMPAEWLDLLVAYLAELAGTAPAAPPSAGPGAGAAATVMVAAAGGPASGLPGAGAGGARVSDVEAAALYRKHCAACHGETGRGDGPNARFLPVRPTAHADAGYMSTRPDDTLFDAIYAGGYAVGRSPRMPPFGWTLTREQIRALVRHLRTLCQCEGPAWSRDEIILVSRER